MTAPLPIWLEAELDQDMFFLNTGLLDLPVESEAHSSLEFHRHIGENHARWFGCEARESEPGISARTEWEKGHCL